MSIISENKNSSPIDKIFMIFSIMLYISFPTDAISGGSGLEYTSIYDEIKDWMQGYLGKLIAISCIIIGITEGIVRQSLIGFVVDISVGIGMFTAPNIIDSVITGTI